MGKERGQSLVELAMLLPLLMMIVLGAVDFGRVFFAYTTIVNAAREGAHCASLPSCSWTAAVDGEIDGALTGGVTRTLTTAGGDVTVTVQHNFAAVTTTLFANTTIPLTASATMAQQPTL